MARAQDVRFPGAHGHELAGRLHPPVGRPRGWALFAHCFTCSKDLRAARAITEALAEEGLGVLRFDFTGLGESEGAFADTTFSGNVDDIVAAATWLAEHHAAPQVLVGHSLGGAAVILAAQDLPHVRAVATVGAPSEPVHVTRQLEDQLDTIAEQGEAEVTIAGRAFRVTQSFVDDLAAHTLEERLADLDAALLVLHSPQDATVGVGHARTLYEAARHPKSFISLDGADHLLSRPEDGRYAGRVIAAWATRYLDAPPARDPDDDDDVEARTAIDSFATELVSKGRHWFRADEPAEVGGDDTGPSPYDLLAAALAACSAMTVRSYAHRKDWPLQAVTAHVRHGKEHRSDCEDDKPAKIDRFRKRLVFEGDLDDDQRDRLVQIASRCPVHRTLLGEIDIVTEDRSTD